MERLQQREHRARLPAVHQYRAVLVLVSLRVTFFLAAVTGWIRVVLPHVRVVVRLSMPSPCVHTCARRPHRSRRARTRGDPAHDRWSRSPLVPSLLLLPLRQRSEQNLAHARQTSSYTPHTSVYVQNKGARATPFVSASSWMIWSSSVHCVPGIQGRRR